MILTIAFAFRDGFQAFQLVIVVPEMMGFIIWIYYMGITHRWKLQKLLDIQIEANRILSVDPTNKVDSSILDTNSYINQMASASSSLHRNGIIRKHSDKLSTMRFVTAQFSHRKSQNIGLSKNLMLKNRASDSSQVYQVDSSHTSSKRVTCYNK